MRLGCTGQFGGRAGERGAQPAVAVSVSRPFGVRPLTETVLGHSVGAPWGGGVQKTAL